MELISLNSIFLILIERLSRGITTQPDLGDGSLIIVVIIYSLFSLLWGFASGFLNWNLCKSTKMMVRVTITSLFAPGILEELFFRVILLPYPGINTLSQSNLLWIGFSLWLFVVYHPLNAVTFFTQARKVFFEPNFLVLATALGITCTVTYYQSGSIWISVLIHWFAVILWLLCFGGLDKLSYTKH